MKKNAFILTLLAFFLVGCNGDSNGKTDSTPKNETFNVTWKNFDGEVLEIDEEVPSGTMPSYDGSLPTRAKTENYEYVFSNWSPELSPVTADITYIALFESTLTAAYVSFDLNGGTTTSNSQSRYLTSIESENFFFNVEKDNYNFRGWEYNGKKIFDNKGNKVDNADIAEEMTFKALFSQTVFLSISSNIKDAGIISGEGEYDYNTSVTLKVSTNAGYKFLGWQYEDGTLISTQLSHPFMMWNDDVEIFAKFEYISYKLSVQSYDDSLGLVLIKGMGQTFVSKQEKYVEYLTKTTVAAYNSTEIPFLGWFDEKGTLVEINNVYEFDMPYQDYKLVAKWDLFRADVLTSNEELGTVNDVSGAYAFKENISLIASPKHEGSEFVGWYLNNEELVSTSLKYDFVMPNKNIIITAVFKLKEFNVNAYSMDSLRGTVSGSGEYKYGSTVTLTANPIGDNILFGWYLDGELLSTSNPYSFTLGNGDVEISARFGILYYISFETNGGEPIDDIVAEEGDAISIEPIKKGYEFVGWYTDPSCSLTSYFEIGNTMPAFTGILYAKWLLITYSISYHLDSRTTNNPSNPTTYNILSDTIKLLDPTVEYGVFDGWYTDSEFNNVITEIVTGSTGNIDLYAKEIANGYTITFVTNGGDSVSPIHGVYGDSIVVPTPTKENSVFVGWYYDESLTQKANLISMPGENITLYAKWAEMYKVFDGDLGKCVYFGHYPQRVVSDETLKNELSKIAEVNSKGYIEYNGDEYAKVRVSTYVGWNTYNNGTKIISSAFDYFKVEPILWRVLDINSGKYCLLADQALCCGGYGSNDSYDKYSKSNIRTYINSTFYESAFTFAEKGSILTTNVDNIPHVTYSFSDSYLDENTLDKVFLLSLSECVNADYGFSSDKGEKDKARQCEPTDYTIACGCDNTLCYKRKCGYWTRSPGLDETHLIYSIGGYGTVEGCINSYSIGIRPAINIAL